jgi:hypothetical protein
MYESISLWRRKIREGEGREIGVRDILDGIGEINPSS